MVAGTLLFKQKIPLLFQEFTANMDADSIVYHRLNPSIMARYIRFRPVNWNNHISMRVEVFGCKQGEVIIYPYVSAV